MTNTIKRLSSLVLVVAMCLSLFCGIAMNANAATGQSYTSVKITSASNPTTVDTFKGVAAQYITASTNTGTYSCAGYVKRFYSKIYGVSVSNLLTGKTPVAAGKYTVKKVSSPKVGDIYYQTNSSGSGHWAIVKKVSTDSKGRTVVTLIEQNWKWKTNGVTYAAKERKITVSTYGYNVKFFRVYNSAGKSVN